MQLKDHPLAWRWIAANPAIPKDDLARIEPNDSAEANRIYMELSPLVTEFSLDPTKFAAIARRDASGSSDVVRDWLGEQRSEESLQVSVVWGPAVAVQTSWSIFMRYWDDFCYPSSDDVLFCPPTREWVGLYAHYEEFQIAVKRVAP